MKKILYFIVVLIFTGRVSAQLPTILNTTGLQKPYFSSLTPTTGGSLSANTYYYIVVAVDTLGGQNGYIRGIPAVVGGANNAVSLSWNATAYAKTYKIFRSLDGVINPWYLLTTTTATSYTDIGSVGTMATPVSTPTTIGIKGNTGLNIMDEMGNNVIKLTSITGNYANYPAVQIGSYLQFGSTGIYGNNGSLVRSYQGMRFEPVDSTYESDYFFKGMLNSYSAIWLRPALQKISMIDPGFTLRTELNQGVEDGSSAIAFKFSTWNALSNASAKLFSVANVNTECFAIMASGSVRTKKIIVTQTGWSDYVFKKDYPLRSVASLEKFISIHNHLPEIPSARQVAAKGIDLGENQALLLKKIEELTLYVIDTHKENSRLKKQVGDLSGRIAGLEKRFGKN